MFFIGGGGGAGCPFRGQYPRAAKNPLEPPPHKTPPFLNHLEERLLDQAQARASYTPFFGVIRVAYPKA